MSGIINNKSKFMNKIVKIITSLLLIFAFSPVFVSAQTTADLQAQINSLLAQIKVLQAQLAASQGGTAYCHTFDTNLGIGSGVGSSSDEVHALVTALDKNGLDVGSLDVSNYDESTASAVSAFQEKYKSEILTPAGLRAGTGYLGARTRAKLNSLYGCLKPFPVGTSVVISGVSGPQSLNVDQTGTWTVTASDSSGGNLSYSVNWGDQPYIVYSNMSLTASMSQQSATFTHSYTVAGTYNPIFTVTNTSGLSAQTSLSVNVGGVTNPASITVLSPNGGETWTRGTAQKITWQDNTAWPPCSAGVGCGARPQRLYDITLGSYYPPCTGGMCPMYAYRAPYTIAKSVSGSSYSWLVGDTWDKGIGPLDGSYTIQICQTGSSTCDSSDSYFKITSDSTNTLTINTDSTLPGGQVGTSYYSALSASGGTGNYTWSIKPNNLMCVMGLSCGSLPPGLALSQSILDTVCSPSPCATIHNPIVNAVISGTPTTAGTYSFGLTATDTSGASASKYFTITVGGTGTSQTTTISSLSPTSGRTGTYVTINGSGFLSTGNSIQFSDYGTYISSNYVNSGTVTFTVPSSLSNCNTTGTACTNMMLPPVSGGSYNVRVVNSNGTSNSVPFTVSNLIPL